ncbi:MAG: ribonuclease E inhibitor RraB [Betaproteobacteria bacterium]|nr:MAG: ribonuclease E inhibitor RraB [Betaproteobacteria bacterium]
MTWPGDADGDVFRRLQSHGFDFEKLYAVDYIIEFKDWPPPVQALADLRRNYQSVRVFEPSDGQNGYVQVTIRELVRYERVILVQRQLTNQMLIYGGVCDSWGVLQE